MSRHALPLVALLLAMPGAARAECTQCTCTLEASALNFGPYDARLPQTTSVADVRVTCEGDNGYVLKLGSGQSGTPLQRRMRSGTSALDYNLFKDPGRSLIWGDGSAGQTGVNGTGSGTYSVYGAIPGGQTPLVGTYNDQLVLTIEY